MEAVLLRSATAWRVNVAKRTHSPGGSAERRLRLLKHFNILMFTMKGSRSPCDTGSAVRFVLGALISALALMGAQAPGDTLDLVGSVEPALQRGVATVSAVESPFFAETPVRRGRFEFRRLPPGSYTLTVIDPRWGAARKTVQVTASFADARGRVRVRMEFERSASGRSERIERQGTVSVAALKVSRKARTALRKARERFARGDAEAGKAWLLKAVELSPSFADAWNELGTIAYKAGRYDEAEERFRTALEHEPLAYAPMVNLGGALLSQARYDEALNFNLMARSMQPGDALANSQLGMNFFHKGELRKAREYLLRAKEIDPSHFSHPQFFLAEIYAREGDFEAARGELDELLRLHPDSQVALPAEAALRRLEAAAARASGN